MKKIVTLCIFAFVIIVGTQSASAQSLVEINAAAAQKTKELKQYLKFDNNTEDVVYQTYQNYERKRYAMNEALAAGKKVSKQEKKELNDMVNNKFKSVFTEEQYALYIEYLKTPK